MRSRLTFNPSGPIRHLFKTTPSGAALALAATLITAAAVRLSSASGPGPESVKVAGLLRTTGKPERNNASQEAGELITINSTGFEPAEITRPAGKFLLEVDNRSEVEEVELRLDRQDGEREISATIHSTAPEWRGELDLSPGV